ncbi:hypothetical protein [Saccharothrix syringae]|uniref:Rhodanese domain-containing protein n=1 Tax=Saccharothrix syringae TaxID=103733 RepID=A0A5Q0H4D2_SACSY|nr:hypothetical protein [Saccharothrix syringae]QFZ21086.1 hypothetical protein EKG83_30190 [Saccharothrix syringae]
MTATTSAAGPHDRIAHVRLLDVRWRPDIPDGRPAHAAGHVPGALRVRPGDGVAVCRGSGVTTAALRIAALHPGSWSRWSSRPDRPVATGAP